MRSASDQRSGAGDGTAASWFRLEACCRIVRVAWNDAFARDGADPAGGRRPSTSISQQARSYLG